MEHRIFHNPLGLFHIFRKKIFHLKYVGVLNHNLKIQRASNSHNLSKIKHQPLWLVLCFLIVKGFEPVVHLASVRLGGDARDIKCDGSRSERTRAEHESLWAGQKKASTLSVLFSMKFALRRVK